MERSRLRDQMKRGDALFGRIERNYTGWTFMKVCIEKVNVSI